jgi:hypothetical protein
LHRLLQAGWQRCDNGWVLETVDDHRESSYANAASERPTGRRLAGESDYAFCGAAANSAPLELRMRSSSAHCVSLVMEQPTLISTAGA